MLKLKFNLRFVAVINRIDRLVSGIVILALNPKSAAYYREEMNKGNIVKEYVCVVKGKFAEYMKFLH